jgi:hypothetical protein
MIRANVALLSTLIGTTIPAILAFVTALKSPAWFKASVNIGLAVVGAVASVLIANPDGIEWKALILSFFVLLFTSETLYKSFWKPFNSFKWIQDRFPGGFGPRVILENRPGLDPDAVLKELTDVVKPVFTTEQWKKLQEILADGTIQTATLTLKDVQRIADQSLLLHDPTAGPSPQE